MLGYQRLDDGIKRLLDDFLGFQLSQTNLFRNRFDDLFLGHGYRSPENVAALASSLPKN